MTTRRKTLGSAFAASLLVTLPACADGSDAVAVPGAEAAATIALDELTTATVATTTPVAAPSTTATTVADTTTTTTTVATTTSTAPTTAATPTTEVEASTTSTAPAEDPFLRPGDTGSRVSLLQIKLIALGYLAAGSDNGTFGPATASAVLAFQGDYGLIVDGIVGPETERALTAAAQSINPEQP